MGVSIYERKQQALKTLKEKLPKDELFYHIMDIASDAIDIYIGGLFCKMDCGRPISTRNKTGLCRHCYTIKYRKKDQYKRLDALRAKYYRKRKKDNERKI